MTGGLDTLGFQIVSTLVVGAAVLGVSLWPQVVVDRPRSVLAVLALVSIAALLLVLRPEAPWIRIELDPSSEPLLPLGDPGRDVYREATLAFGTDDIYVVALETDDVFTAEHLELLRRVGSRIRQLPGVRSAESLADVYNFRYDPDNDWVEVDQFIDEIPTAPAELAELRARALRHPLYRKTIVNADGTAAAINVRFKPMTDGEFVALDLDGRIRRILEEERTEGVEFYVSGRPHIRSVAHHVMVRDLLRLIPLAVLVAAIVVLAMGGSIRTVLIPLTSCLTSTLWTFGALAVVGKDLNLITIVLGPTLICVGSVYGVHVMARYEHIARTAPDARSAALETLGYTRVPVLMAGFTTCVGFGALTIADIPAVGDLGGFSLLGVTYVTLLSLTWVPAVLSLLPLRASGGAGLARPVEAAVDAILRGIGHLTTHRPVPVLVAWGIVAVAGSALIPRILIDTDYLRFFDARSEVRTDFAQVNRVLTGVVPIYVVFDGPGEAAFRDPQALRALARIQERLERTEGVSQVLSLVDFVGLINGAFQGAPPGEGLLPDSPQGVAEVVFMIPKDEARRFATSNHSSANLVVRTGELGSRAIRRLEGRILEAVRAEALPPGIRVRVTGNTILINKSADGISGDQARTVGFATITILIVVSFVFRSLRIGLLTMVPNIVPVLLFFGALGAGVATLSLATSLIGSIALGIAIDDTVHFLVSYKRVRAEGLEPLDAARETILNVGRPIVTTSVMLVAGFLVLLLSGFATLREFGYLTAMTMAICLSTDLILFPALLVRLRA